MLGLGLLDEVWACGLVSLGAVVGNFLSLSLRQCVFEASRIEIPAVGWRAGVLSPGIGERTGVNPIEPERVDQVYYHLLRTHVVTGY